MSVGYYVSDNLCVMGTAKQTCLRSDFLAAQFNSSIGWPVGGAIGLGLGSQKFGNTFL